MRSAAVGGAVRAMFAGLALAVPAGPAAADSEEALCREYLAVVEDAVDRFLVRGDSLSESTNAAAWDTADADLLFLPGDDDAHTLTVTGAAGGG